MDKELDWEKSKKSTENNNYINCSNSFQIVPANNQQDIQEVIDIMNDDILSREGKPKEWKLSDFQIGMSLGRGAYGRVYLAREKKTRLFVALKVLMKENFNSGRRQHQVLREIENLSHLQHPHIISLYTYFHDEKRIYLVLEYAGGGDVFTLLSNQPKQRFSERRSAKYAYQVADALEYCHQKKVIHRDIKPENLLLDIHDNIKLADFGSSVHAPSKKQKTRCGTIIYLAPEIVECKLYNNYVDHWCLGLLLYQFLVGRPPFEGHTQQELFNKICNVQINYPSFLKEGSIDLISKLVRYNPEERISLKQFKSHPWLVENKNKFLST